jgi:Tfp pilus assembly protein PilN
MIGTNLATRPFYNERAVRVCLTVVGVLVALATLYNGARILQYGRSDSALGAQATADERRAAELRGTAVRLRSSVNTKEVEASTTRVRAANALIDRRVFSWTELLARLEATLPGDVRIASIKPKTDGGRTSLSLSVLAKSVDDVSRFMENLEATGVFSGVLSRAERVGESGQLEVALEAVYTPAPAPPKDAVNDGAAEAAKARTVTTSNETGGKR